MKKIIEYLTVIFNPRFWIMNESYSNVWDRNLNELMDKYEFERINRHRAKLGDVMLWVENYPYSFLLHPYENVRPSRITILRAWKKLNNECPYRIKWFK